MIAQRWSSRQFWLAVGSILLVTAISIWMYSDLRDLVQTAKDGYGLAPQAFGDLALSLFLRWLGFITLIVGGYLGVNQIQKARENGGRQ